MGKRSKKNKHTNRIVIIIGILLALAIAAFLVFKFFIKPKDPNNPTPDSPKSEIQKLADASRLVSGDIVVGSKIKIDGKPYRILKIYENQITVLALADVGIEKMAFDNTPEQVSYFSYSCLKYDGSDVDKAINDWAEHLSFKSAIVPKYITQTVYNYNENVNSGFTIPDKTFDFNGVYYGLYMGHNYALSRYASSSKSGINVGDRLAYLLDLDDIIDYLGVDNISTAKLQEMFDIDTGVYWLRSASANHNSCAMYVTCAKEIGRVYYMINNNLQSIRPSFILDLTKIK